MVEPHGRRSTAVLEGSMCMESRSTRMMENCTLWCGIRVKGFIAAPTEAENGYAWTTALAARSKGSIPSISRLAWVGFSSMRQRRGGSEETRFAFEGGARGG